MRINELEENKLRNLYEQANEEDTPEAWQDVRDYYKELGKKYGFKPERVMIDTNGEVRNRSNESVYVVFDSRQAIPIAVYRSKKEAMEHTMSRMEYHWDEVNMY